MYRIIENPAQELWDSYVQRNDMATIFHTTAWKNVIQKSFGHTPLYAAVFRDGEIAGILPLFKIASIFTGKRLVSLPYSSIGGPLAESDTEKELLIEYAEERRASLNCAYMELRTRDGINSHRFSVEERSTYLNSWVELDNDSDRMWRRISEHGRTPVRKAEKSGLTVREADSEEDMKSFYRLNLLTRKTAFLLFPWIFFEALLKNSTENCSLPNWERKRLGHFCRYLSKIACIMFCTAASTISIDIYVPQIYYFGMSLSGRV